MEENMQASGRKEVPCSLSIPLFYSVELPPIHSVKHLSLAAATNLGCEGSS